MTHDDSDTSLDLGDRLPAKLEAFVEGFPATGVIQPVGYTRYSTDRQKTTSTARQRNKIIRYADNQVGWCRPLIFSDEAVPGVTTSREQFDAMFDYCGKHPGTPIIVENMSRIARDGGAYQEFFRRRREVRAVTHMIGFGQMDELQEGIFQTFASYEYRNLIGTMRDGRSQAAEAGKKVGRLPFGVLKDANGFIDFDPDWAPTIKQIFKSAALGMPASKIAKYLHALGFPGPAAGGEWPLGLISRIIKNPVYAGKRIHNPGVLAWEAPPSDVVKLIDLEVAHYSEVTSS